jgi:hypothetical protein
VLYIHGINHNTQHRGVGVDSAGADRFEALVDWVCQQNQIELIAEEFSLEACELSGVSASICAEYAVRNGLQHLYCDPTLEERIQLGIPSQKELVTQVKAELGVKIIVGSEHNAYYDRVAAKYHPIREGFWLDKLSPYAERNILFICGSDHVESFSALLKASSWQVCSV